MDRVRRWLPEGGKLPSEEWDGRHRGFVIFLWIQAAGLAAFGLVRGLDPLHSVAEGAVVGAFGIAAANRKLGRELRSVIATLGLLSASAILVHMSGGTIEAHFHFFVMVGLVTLYQSWSPFLLAIGYVVLHHGVVGTISPESVYNHPAAVRSPFTWAAIHGAFVLSASTVSLLVWKRNEDLRKKEQEHIALTRALDAFSSNVAHDLRTPLGAIQGAAATAARLVEEGRVGADLPELLRIIQGQSRRASNLVVGLLTLARTRGEPRIERLDLRHLIADLASDYPGLVVSVAGGNGPVEADRVALRQALGNLLENAFKHARGARRRGHVHVAIEADAAGWSIAVADQGPGIDDEDVAAIFNPLVKGRKVRQGDGAGLGLAIVAAVAESHGGRVWYEPNLGGGSRFVLFIPRPASRNGSSETLNTAESQVPWASSLPVTASPSQEMP